MADSIIGIIHGHEGINEDIIGQITEIIKYNKTTKHQFIDNYINLSDSWGTTENDVHFIHTDTGSLGKNNDYNTYHYEKRYTF